MATLDEWNRVIISGTLGNAEVWSTSVAWADVSSGSSTALTSTSNLLGVASGIWTDLTNGSAARVPFDMISTSGRITQVRVEARNVGGLLNAAEFAGSTPLPGVGAPSKPTTAASVVSLLTGVPGRRYRGRMYLPAMALTIGTDFRIPAATTEIIAEGMDARFDAWSTVFNSGETAIVPVVVSEVGLVCTEVQQLRVGDVFDTQRRRRDDLQETYFTVTR